jgi:PAS domain S-box-containing protein
MLAELALHEAVVSATRLSPQLRGLIDATCLALIIGPLFGWTLYRRHVDQKVVRLRGATTRAVGSPHRKIRLVMFGALGVMVMVTGVMVAVERHAMLAMLDIGDAMNLAGRQRSLSQEIARRSATAHASPIDLHEFTAVVRRLRTEADSLDRLLRPMFAKGEQEADIADSAGKEAAAERDALLTTIDRFVASGATARDVTVRADAMLVAQEQFVGRLAELAAINLRRIQRAEWTFGLLLIAVLLGVAGLVVEPVVRLLRRQHDAATARSLEFERLAMVAQRTSTAVVITDAAGRITWVNDAFTRLTGWRLDEALGQSPGALLQSPDTDPATVQALRAALREERSIRTTILNRTRAGVPYWLDLSIEPLRENGRLTGFLAVETDVTEAVQVQEALRLEREALAQTTAQLEEAQTVARMGNWSLDVATETVRWSPGTFWLFGRAPELGPPSLTDAVAGYHPDAIAPLADAIAHTRRTGEPYALVLRTSGQNPAVRWVEAQGRARVGADGAVCELFGIAIDVTERVEKEEALRRAQERAESANRSKSEFLANMSHEIRTPLTAIMGYADWLREDCAQVVTIEQHRALDTIHRASTHLLAVINDILDLSKIEAGKLVTEELETVLPAVLLDVESIARARAAGKGVTLETRLLSPIPERIITDPTRLRQILMNLVGNAVKFTEHGRVRVDVSVTEATPQPILRLMIEDTGVGMTAEQVQELFQPFHQADASVTRRFGGTGLGLSISRRLAALLGGDVSVVSSTPGLGTRFAIQLPLRTVADTAFVDRLAATAPGMAEAPPPNALDGVRLLLAEDGEDNQRLLRVLLEAAGADVTVVANGVQALDAVEWSAEAGAPFDILVTDMQMPEMDGYTLASTLRTRGESLPIVALTAHAMAEDRQRCLDAGCSDYAVKPVNRRALIAMVAQWTNRTAAPTVTPRPIDADDLPRSLASDLADDPDLGPLAEAFAQVLPTRIEAIAAHRHPDDAATGRRLVHQLKGAAGSYGFPLISAMATELESAWESDDRATRLLDRLRQVAAAAGRSPIEEDVR